MKEQIQAVREAVPADVLAKVQQPQYHLHDTVNVENLGAANYLINRENRKTFANCQVLGPDIIVWYMQLLSKHYPDLISTLTAAINAVTSMPPISLVKSFSMTAATCSAAEIAAQTTVFPHLPQPGSVLILPMVDNKDYKADAVNHYYLAILNAPNSVTVVDGYHLRQHLSRRRLRIGPWALTHQQKRQLCAHFATRDQESGLGQAPLRVTLVKSSEQLENTSCAFRAMAALTLWLEVLRRRQLVNTHDIYPDFMALDTATDKLRSWMEDRLLADGRPGVRFLASGGMGSTRQNPIYKVEWNMEQALNAAHQSFEEVLLPYFNELYLASQPPEQVSVITIDPATLPLTTALSTMAYLSAQLAEAGQKEAISKLTLRQAVIDMAQTLDAADNIAGSAESHADEAKKCSETVVKMAVAARRRFRSTLDHNAAAAVAQKAKALVDQISDRWEDIQLRQAEASNAGREDITKRVEKAAADARLALDEALAALESIQEFAQPDSCTAAKRSAEQPPPSEESALLAKQKAKKKKVG
jgi:hypothetical protein